MANPQHATTEINNDIPFYDLDAFADDAEMLDEASAAPPPTARKTSSKAAAEGLARRQLEERREAQRLSRLLSDYAWDDHDI